MEIATPPFGMRHFIKRRFVQWHREQLYFMNISLGTNVNILLKNKSSACSVEANFDKEMSAWPPREVLFNNSDCCVWSSKGRAGSQTLIKEAGNLEMH